MVNGKWDGHNTYICFKFWNILGPVARYSEDVTPDISNLQVLLRSQSGYRR